VDGAPRGFALAGDSEEADAPRALQLFILYQYATEHGTGTGQALLDAVIGDEPAFLWTAEENPRAIAFYRRNGFEPDGARVVSASWENLAEIRMVR
jgi:GNAT superfamily N-acetyltransferase